MPLSDLIPCFEKAFKIAFKKCLKNKKKDILIKIDWPQKLLTQILNLKTPFSIIDNDAFKITTYIWEDISSLFPKTTFPISDGNIGEIYLFLDKKMGSKISLILKENTLKIRLPIACYHGNYDNTSIPTWPEREKHKRQAIEELNMAFSD